MVPVNPSPLAHGLVLHGDQDNYAMDNEPTMKQVSSESITPAPFITSGSIWLQLWFPADWTTATQCSPVCRGQQSHYRCESKILRLDSCWTCRHVITIIRIVRGCQFATTSVQTFSPDTDHTDAHWPCFFTICNAWRHSLGMCLVVDCVLLHRRLLY